MTSHHIYVGCYVDASSPSIQHFAFDTNTGKMAKIDEFSGIENPSFLALHPKGRALYAVSEAGAEGALHAISRDASTGKLGAVLNQLSSKGESPCHVSVQPDGSRAFVANYSSGSVTAYSLEAEGALKAITDHHQHTGSGSNPARQERAHAHCARLSPDGQYLIVPDLGIDTWVVYKIDATSGKLSPHNMAFANSGYGPRHIAFHPNGRFAYGINELVSSVTAFAWEGARGELRELQSISSLPADFKGESYCAEVCVSPNGKFVYGSNRGHNSIAIYTTNTDGTLKLLGIEPTHGDWPRNFALTPEGRWLLVANQNSNDVQIFSVDIDGRLKHHATGAQLAKPACVLVCPQ